MSIFTEESTMRPLFEEPIPDLEHQNSSEEPLGFLIGGMANAPLQHLGQQYYDAAYVLTETIRLGEWDDYQLANPVLYLYRHSIELFLKSVMDNTGKTHSLYQLATQFSAYIKQKFNCEVPNWVTNRLKEIADIDPNSTAFRYSSNYDKVSGVDKPIQGELHVDLLHLQNAMKVLNTALVGVLGEVKKALEVCP
jgi:hypothetical protein